MYKQHASPFFRVIKGGVPVSWQPAVATATLDISSCEVIWSPCNRFAAVFHQQSYAVVDSVTLNQLNIFQRNFGFMGYEQIGFSPDSHYLTILSKQGIVCWDLQTGGQLSAIPSKQDPDLAPYSFTHSNDGKVVAAAYRGRNAQLMHISTYNLLSGTHVGSTNHPQKGRVIYPIWTHDDEYFQFATVDLESITIWQSPFSLEHPAVEVETLPSPAEIASGAYFVFLPALSRLAFTLGNTIQVWDVKASKLLLKSDTQVFVEASFSSDGHFFAHAKTPNETYVWKESLTGYVFHQWFSFPHTYFSVPYLSPNGKSVIVSHGSKIHRMDTRNKISCGPSISTGYHRAVLDFFPNENFAAFAQLKDNIVTILDLKSGEPRSIINVGVEIDCLGITGGTIIVVGGGKAITWNFSGGIHTVSASISESMQTITLNCNHGIIDITNPSNVSISPDFSHIVVSESGPLANCLEVYDALTGKFLANIQTEFVIRPHFSPDGCNIWASNVNSYGQQYKIDKDGETGHIELEVVKAENPSMVPPWKLSGSGHS